MPLGQAPYGSRTPAGRDEPPDGDPRPGPGRFGGAGRWMFSIAFIALLAYFAALASRSGVKGPARAGGVAGPSECLTDRSCAEGWRCFAIPKDDPFAVTGRCAQACEGDLQCPAHFACQQVAVGDHQVVPLGARGAKPETLGVCQPCGEGGCRPE